MDKLREYIRILNKSKEGAYAKVHVSDTVYGISIRKHGREIGKGNSENLDKAIEEAISMAESRVLMEELRGNQAWY